MNSSIWSQEVKIEMRNPLSKDIKTTAAIIGGGIAGILSAYFLSLKGVDCVILESGKIAGGVTKNTTAKITSQHNIIYKDIIKSYGKERARQYLSANQYAVEEYKKLCGNMECDFKILPSFVYSKDNIRKLEAEAEALRSIGFNAKIENKIDIPIKISGALKFDGQAQFNPLKFIKEISKELTIYENTFVRKVDGNVIITDKGKVEAENIVIASHFPFINTKGMYFMRMYQQRSYVLCLRGVQKVNGMYIDEAEDGLSFRDYKDMLLFGGGGRRTGENTGGYDKLRKLKNKIYPDAEEICCWSAQDCITLDSIPYIGRYSKRTPYMFVSTGFNKWGMTSAMVGGRILCDMITGVKNEYEDVFSPSRFKLNKKFFINMAQTGKNLIIPTTKRCSHLGCALKYNIQESSWDCPCHGSRFNDKGEIIDNPAMRGIKVE